jgi:hypothetical protein
VRYAASSTGDDPFALARLLVAHDTGPAAFASLLAGQATPGILFQRARAQVWRWVRHSLYRGHGVQRKKVWG